MKDLLHAYLELNSVLPFYEKDKLLELQELVEQFNEEFNTNFDVVNASLEYMSHAAKFQS